MLTEEPSVLMVGVSVDKSRDRFGDGIDNGGATRPLKTRNTGNINGIAFCIKCLTNDRNRSCSIFDSSSVDRWCDGYIVSTCYVDSQGLRLRCAVAIAVIRGKTENGTAINTRF